MTDGVLTELEQTKMQLFALRHQAMQRDLQINLAERGAYIKQIEAAHPGYRWHDATGALVKEPDAP